MERIATARLTSRLINHLGELLADFELGHDLALAEEVRRQQFGQILVAWDAVEWPEL